ncbi:hypothetical protein CVT25_015278 [Psilocybe cyanescens]|uniref:Phytocyanin domain-containing protein n=1 Tax=Psilocybe cyanescens TaxID=93625 RepID=A0A409XRC8_PSICY|nr:hypothetical protein CVT25_015278 [Psilocybe cyanescens]
MHFSVVATALLSATFVAAADHVVQVGANNALVFDPTNITAVDGDTSVTQSTFASPCVQQTTPTQGVTSGFMFINTTTGPFPQWQISVTNASTPLWFFCAQTNPKPHCELGMVFAVNAPPAKSFAQFQAAAMASTPSNSTTGNTTSSGGAATNGTTGGSASTPGSGSASSGSGAPAAPPANSTGSANSGALKLGGSAAGIMTVAALFTSFIL